MIRTWNPQLTEDGIKLIKSFESCELVAYRDVVNVLTIGWGHTSKAGPPKVYEGMVITQHEADQILENDLKKFEKYVRDRVKVPLTNREYSALVSFCFNVGPASLTRSTLLKKLNKGQYKAAAYEFLKWVYANKKKYRGLIRRRKAEMAMFLR